MTIGKRASRAAGKSAVNGQKSQPADERSSPPTEVNGDSLHTPPSESRAGKGVTSKNKKRATARLKAVKAPVEEQDIGDSELDEDISDDAESEDSEDEGDTVTVNVQELPIEHGVADSADIQTPRKRGRPKGSKTKRSPTPEGDLAPEERYFWQNRPGPAQVSSNTLGSLNLLTHEEYFEEIRKTEDHHDPEKAYLIKLHARSYPQWRFELDQGYNVCLYGYGSKRDLLSKFANWLYTKMKPAPCIIVVNGYTPRLNIRTVINTIATAIVKEEDRLRLVGSPQEMLDTLLAHLSIDPPDQKIILIVNSIDAVPIRRTSIQTLLSNLASHPSVSLIATADTPSFPLLWPSTTRDKYTFIHHDCTTYAPYTAELDAVTEMNDLLNRKGRRTGGKEGVSFVLKSLPENARSLYRILLSEVLSLIADAEGGGGGMYSDDDDERIDPDLFDTPPRRKRKPAAPNEEELAVEYRALYQKATEEFICSSDMNFRFLLKEFHDHQMITTRRDASGAELLGVPLSKEDMEGVLEDLVIG